ncbi:hypothetical protein V6N13_148357 [Hibiscus sabdariffa]|uniref:Uncharacterized protein n=1 Tax=Hibiscus sabdariffa TaxID=183260 RepID=A0ABR2TYF5_9ROSI
MVYLSFFFGSKEVLVLRRLLSPHHPWQCHTKALQRDPDEDVLLICIVNARSKFNPPLSPGYYSNAIAYMATMTTVGQLCRGPLEYAIELVKKST